jgi:hypothetical protein
MASITLQLRPETEQRLREKAALRGQTLEAYLQQLAEREAASANGSQTPAGKPSLDELLAPVQQRFAQSGMTEDELAALVEEAREEVWQGKQKARKTS